MIFSVVTLKTLAIMCGCVANVKSVGGGDGCVSCN